MCAHHAKDVYVDQSSTREVTGDAELRQPTFEVIDFETPTETPTQTGEQSSELDIIINNSSSSQDETNDAAAGLDPSWLAVAKSRVACVICTVRGFQVRCMRSATGSVTSGGAAAEVETEEAQCVDRMAACRQCGLLSDWHKLGMRACGKVDERLRDDELVRVARVLALWEQMKSVGAGVLGFDRKEMAEACVWLESGPQSRELAGKSAK